MNCHIKINYEKIMKVCFIFSIYLCHDFKDRQKALLSIIIHFF